jgi:hypothetical protein
MRMTIPLIALGLTLLALADAGAGEDLKFDEVILVQKNGQVDLLYVVLTDEKSRGVDDYDKAVVQYAKAALREAAKHEFKGTTKPGEKYKHDGNVVFVVRRTRKDMSAAATGFSVEQLQEILAAGPKKGLELARAHTWGFEHLPIKQ